MVRTPDELTMQSPICPTRHVVGPVWMFPWQSGYCSLFVGFVWAQGRKVRLGGGFGMSEAVAVWAAPNARGAGTVDAVHPSSSAETRTVVVCPGVTSTVRRTERIGASPKNSTS